MKKTSPKIVSASIKASVGVLLLAIAAVAGASAAVADPIIPQAGSEPADATISDLQNAGFDVRINYTNGSPNVPLSACKVTDINNPNGPDGEHDHAVYGLCQHQLC